MRQERGCAGLSRSRTVPGIDFNTRKAPHMTDQMYILVNDEIRPASLMEWARFVETGGRRIARDNVGDLLLSTVFLGIDQGCDDGEPLLFETMVLAPNYQDEFCEHASTLEDAKAAHQRGLDFARNKLSAN